MTDIIDTDTSYTINVVADGTGCEVTVYADESAVVSFRADDCDHDAALIRAAAIVLGRFGNVVVNVVFEDDDLYCGAIAYFLE